MSKANTLTDVGVPATPTLLAPRDVAKRLNLSTSRIIQLNREGVLPAIRDSAGRRIFEQAVVERFARERKARAAQKEL
jgi:DNA-binding transcriptional MerR regulator